jgi:oxygen-dependent protoporphyrinogen oxidase
LPVIVVGAGVTGLTAAYRLHKAGRKVLVLEAKERAGGNIQTEKRDGFLYDLGPDSFLRAKPAGAALVSELGLDDEVISPLPGASQVHVARDGVLHPMPEGLSLGVPKRPGPLLMTPLLSPAAKLRAMMEPFVRRPADPGEESIYEFLARRLGPEMAERLAAPLLSGVYAGDAKKLSMDAAFPQLVGLEKKFGSLFSGMNGGKSILKVLTEDVKSPPSPFMTLRGGLGDLVQALVSALPAGALRLGAEVGDVKAPKTEGDSVSVSVAGEWIEASHVILAGPPWSARPVVASVAPTLEQSLGQVRGFSTATVFLGLEKARAQSEFSGSGFIVPPGEAEILASTFISSKWESRAPDDAVLVRAFVGGARKDIRGLSDDDLGEVAERELARFLGALGPITFRRVHRYARGTPQPELGFNQVLSRIKAAIDERTWISLIGSGYGGAGIPDCIRQADTLAETLTEH